MTSLWLDRTELPTYAPVADESSYDVAVVGGGLTGLTTALLLARAGVKVAVLEARSLGAVTTGHSTAKVSLLQATRLSQIASRHSAEAVHAYVEGNREGLAWLARYCQDQGLPVQHRDAWTYAGAPEARQSVEAELRAGQQAGLDMVWEEDAGLPYATFGAVRLADQAQIDPAAVVAALARDITQHGGVIHEHSRVAALRSGSPCTLTVNCERDALRTGDPVKQVRADRVVVATGIPVFDRGGFFARLEPSRSYALAFEVPGDIPRGMYISADSPVRSLRTAPHGEGELLLVGGSGHTVGRAERHSDHVAALTAWTERHFPGARRTHTWSAQDYRDSDHLPSVGPLVPTSGRVLTATGYDKWGMAMAVGASVALSAEILGGNVPWAQELRPWRKSRARGLPGVAQLNASVAFHMVTDWVKPRSGDADSPPPEGEGRVEGNGPRRVAASTVDGVTRRHSAVCPHLGGILTWNDAERSWDCPLHGSRFTPDGSVLEGPATCGLRPAEEAGKAPGQDR